MYRMLFNDIAYGPIHSRRLGVSLGMEIMPLEHKLCTFNCVYCECGWNEPVAHPKLPTREEVKAALEAKLSTFDFQQAKLDVITFSGNGEPTLHPDFNGIIRDTCALRDRYCPSTKVSVLSNSTQLGRKNIVEALWLCDNRILKLDAATDEMMRRIDMPVNDQLTVETLINWLAQFNGDFTLQTCFLRGEHDGKIIDNTTPKELNAWYRTIERLRPKQVMIYVIDRKTPEEHLEKISPDEMEQIAAPLREKGVPVIISA
ncbi:MAG: radical SAM protein [Paludibacteraceae bacterium]|nr:radical SAM protein [Paludibacteraceae bacterium]MBQ2190739.1 radical SAM protein [Paludibacteraceae bacterium]